MSKQHVKFITYIALLINIGTIVALSRETWVSAMRINRDWASIIEITLVIVLFSISWVNDKLSESAFQSQIRQSRESIRFVNSFEYYCKECMEAIVDTEDESEIITIQTPLMIDEHSSPDRGYYKQYIKQTANQLLIKNSSTDIHKIKSYKRLIVINDCDDENEIKSEKEKLKIFVEAIYDGIKSLPNNEWKPVLGNIHIGLVNAKSIQSSPFSNLDILVILKRHLIVAFPEEGKENKYMWGTSIHLNNANNGVAKFDDGMQAFDKIYEKVWENSGTRKIDFGAYHQHENHGFSKTRILEMIDLTFGQIKNI
jgi:hypothetical protein